MEEQTLESMFIMYRTTKDPVWRERGWGIWEAIEAKTKTDSAYANVLGVGSSDPRHEDVMPRWVCLRLFLSFSESLHID